MHGLDIRTARVEDAPAVRAFLEGLSEDTRSLRYHSPVPRVKSWMVDAVVRSDGVKHGSVLACFEGRLVGIAEWGRIDPSERSADIAVVVRDDCRRHGIARALIDALTRSGRDSGIETFSASVLSTNRPTIALIEHVAPKRTTRFEGPTVEVLVPLQPTA